MLDTLTRPAIAADVPLGWATPPAAPVTTIPAFDTAARLIPGAAAAPELVQLLGVWSRATHPVDAIVEPKIDGHRALFLGGGERAVLSREGARMGMAAHCIPALRQLEARFGQPMMFDGEFAVPGGLPRTIAASRRNRPAPDGVFWLFDAVPLAEWQRGRSTQPLSVRKAAIARVFPDGLCSSVGRVLGFEMTAGETIDMAQAFWRRQFEGLVVKSAASLYIRGRSPGWLKLKEGR